MVTHYMDKRPRSLKVMMMKTDSTDDENHPLSYDSPSGDYYDPEEDWW